MDEYKDTELGDSSENKPEIVKPSLESFDYDHGESATWRKVKGCILFMFRFQFNKHYAHSINIGDYFNKLKAGQKTYQPACVCGRLFLSPEW